MLRSIAFVSTFLVVLLVAGCGNHPDQNTEPPTSSDTLDARSAEDTVSRPEDAGIESSDTTATSGEDDEMTIETNYFEIQTPHGRMVVRLYDKTPVHRDNFRKLVAEGYYDGTTFHRVIEGFMIQGGDGLSKDDDPANDGMGEIGYTLESEIRDDLFHVRGALAAARQGDQVNPERRSSGSQFYIVQGTVSSADELVALESQMKLRVPGFELSGEAKEAYTTEGGTPFLDGQYTVFGELVEGFDVLDVIAATETPRKAGERVNPAMADRPPEPIRMEVRPLPDYPS